MASWVFLGGKENNAVREASAREKKKKGNDLTPGLNPKRSLPATMTGGAQRYAEQEDKKKGRMQAPRQPPWGSR